MVSLIQQGGQARVKRLSENHCEWMIGLGALVLLAGAAGMALEQSLLDSARFGRALAASLEDARVAAYAAEMLTDAVQAASPDLVAARPLLLATAEGIVVSRPFMALVERAGRGAHHALFSQKAYSLVLTIPDVEILVRGALAQASPGLAARIPANLDSALAALSSIKKAKVWIGAARLAGSLAWAFGLLLLLGPALLTASVWWAPDRRRALLRAGLALCAVGVALMAVLPAGRLAAAFLIPNPLERGLAQGLWSSLLSGLRSWGLFLAGFGVLFCSGAASVFEVVDPFQSAKRVLAFFADPPPGTLPRLVWGSSLLLAGTVAIVFPHEITGAFVVLAGGILAYLGMRELFRLLLQRVDRFRAVEAISDEGRWLLHVGLVLIGVISLGLVWFAWRSPMKDKPAMKPLTCNGLPELCALRLNEAVFAGAHNAMSNEEVPGWLFPHHQRSIPRQLEDGIRALLLDVHYGMPGGARIKTDLSQGLNRDRLIQALGKEGFDAAMRIRNRLVGVREADRRLYFCHGFCELGAYEVEPALRQIRDFLIQHPDEVLILIVEDYVTPRDLAGAFDRSGLSRFVYRGRTEPVWPTLQEMIGSGERVVMLIESGRQGVDWLRPAFQIMQETPYSFHTVEEFSCAPNRGGAAGRLFLMNHWVETTPTPKPTNAATVNRREFLVSRARRCAAERGKMPNILAVDFYGAGDVVGAARELNRAQSAQAMAVRAAGNK